MALAITLVNGTWFDTTNKGSSSAPYLTNSGTNTYTAQLVAGRRYFMVIHSYSAGAAEAISSVTHDPAGTPLSFSLVTDGSTSAQLQGWGLTGNTVEVWGVEVGSTTADAAIEIIYAGTQSACGAGLFYITGHDTSGTIVQVTTGTGTSTSAAPGTMASFGATDNGTLLVVARDDTSGGISPDESRSELYENNETERNNHALHYQFPHGSDTTLTATLNVSDDWAAFGIEIKAASTGVTGSGSPSIPASKVTGSGSGTETFSGSGTPSIAASKVTGSGSGEETFTGSGTPSIAATQATGSGSGQVVDVIGSGTPSIAATQATGTGSGEETFTGSGTPSIAATQATGSGSGEETFTGSGTPSIAAGQVTASGAGQVVHVIGSGAPSVPASQATGAGSGEETFTGSGTPTIPASLVTGSGSGAETFTGSGTPTIPASMVTASGSGTVTGAEEVTGTGAPVVPASQATGSGSGLVAAAPKAGRLTRGRAEYHWHAEHDRWGDGVAQVPAIRATGDGGVALAPLPVAVPSSDTDRPQLPELPVVELPRPVVAFHARLVLAPGRAVGRGRVVTAAELMRRLKRRDEESFVMQFLAEEEE